jgi:AraC-like DNA-binding protein
MSSKLKEPILQFVRDNVFDKNLSLKLLASHFNLSEAYVSRLFKELFEQNFHSFVEDYRMTEAARLLRDSTLNIAEIAERVGYFNTRTFRRVFLQHYGVSPSRYRQR